MPAFERILCRIAQLPNGRSSTFVEFFQALDGSNAIFVRVHELPPSSPRLPPHPRRVKFQSARTLWGQLKVGRLCGRRFATRQHGMDEVIDWLTFYNYKRFHSPLGYVSPMTFEQRWTTAQQQRWKFAQWAVSEVRKTGARSARRSVPQNVRPSCALL